MKLRQKCSKRRFVTHYGKSPGFHNHWIFHVRKRGITITKDGATRDGYIEPGDI